MLTIELITPPYLEETKKLMNASFEKRYHSIFFLNEASTLIARIGERVVGGVNLDIFGTIGYIGWLYVDSQERGKGIAQALVNEATAFLFSQGCKEITACVEGDNYPSAKQLTSSGFSIMGPLQQLVHFRFKILQLNKRASRFFDMGYFLYVKTDKSNQRKEAATNLPALIGTIILNTIFLLPLLFNISLMKLVSYPNTVIAVPALVLLVRTLTMMLVARNRGVYRPWDTAYLWGFLAPLLIGLPFPVPGNVYLKDKPSKSTLKRMGLISNLSLVLIIFLLPSWALRIYPITLLIFDTFFTWYPFEGFNAKRMW